MSDVNILQSLVPLQPVSVLRVLVLVVLVAGLLVHLLVAGVLVQVRLHHLGRPSAHASPCTRVLG